MVEWQTAPRATALRAPWSLTPNLQQHLKQFLRKWHLQVLAYQVPCHTPSFKMVFIKHAAVLDQLCNHKQAIIDWSTSQPATYLLQKLGTFQGCGSQSIRFSLGPRRFTPTLTCLQGVGGHRGRLLVEQGLSIQKGISQPAQTRTPELDKAKTAYRPCPIQRSPTLPPPLDRAFQTCHVPHHQIFDHPFFNKPSKGQSSTLKTNNLPPCESTARASTTKPSKKPFRIRPFSSRYLKTRVPLSHLLLRLSSDNMANPTLGGRQRTTTTHWLHPGKTQKRIRSGRPIISFVDSPFRPMLNILARMIFQLISVACPNHFASGDVYTLLSILKSAPVDADLILVNQDLAGFFTSIDQDRFIGARFMLLDFLRPHMNVSDNEAFSVYPGKTNNPGDIIKGRTFRLLNVTRKIIIKDVPDLLRAALNMQTFALGHQCLQQSRGSPMGSPLSPALCLMVVSISEQIWSINFKQILSNHNLSIRHIRYVDNPPHLWGLSPSRPPTI